MTPLVALVGRPNSGKSALFNRLIRKRKAIVSPVAGTTRDVLHEEITVGRKKAILMDMAGLSVGKNEQPLARLIREQTHAALDSADVIVFCVDAHQPLTKEDAWVAESIRKAKKPVLLVATKADNDAIIAQADEVYGLGLGEVFFVSSEHNLGIAELKTAIGKAISGKRKAVGDKRQAVSGPAFTPFRTGRQRQAVSGKEQRQDEAINRQSSQPKADPPLAEIVNPSSKALAKEDRQFPISVSLVGKPNVGKSSLFNALVGEKKAIVSDIPGTTRDAIDTTVEKNERKFLIVDTAGLRRPGKRERGIEFYSVRRCMDAIERSDVCLLIVDGMETVSKMDQAVARTIIKEKKGLIIVVNKWDVAKGGRVKVKSEKSKVENKKQTDESPVYPIPNTKYQYSESFPGEAMMNRYLDYLQEKFDYIPWAPVLFISAKTGENVDEIWRQVEAVWQERHKRIGTGQFNAFLQKAALKQHPTGTKGIFPKIYYGTQVETDPPHIVLFVNQPDAFHFSWRRYLEHRLREQFGFVGTPVEIEYRERSRNSPA